MVIVGMRVKLVFEIVGFFVLVGNLFLVVFILLWMFVIVLFLLNEILNFRMMFVWFFDVIVVIFLRLFRLCNLVFIGWIRSCLVFFGEIFCCVIEI